MNDTAARPHLWAAVLTAGGGGILLDGAIITSAYRGSSSAADDTLAFPWEGATAVASSLSWGLAQVLMLVGLVAFARSDARVSRSERVGSRVAVAGGAAYIIAHGVSVIGHNAATDDVVALLAMSLFGIGTVALAVGLLLAGWSSRHDLRRATWARWAPLALGAWMVVMIPLQFTPALAVAVGGYAVLVIAFGASLINDRATTQP
jgi:hypothetical protein